MALKGEVRLESKTVLARLRVQRGLTQQQMAAAIGCGIATYQRLEEGHHSDPRLRWLVEAAIVLGTNVTSLIEPDWLRSTRHPAHARLMPSRE